MKKLLVIIGMFIFMTSVSARRGCCSHHGGVAGCSDSGRQVCADGTFSPSCTCTPTYVSGCTDQTAKNYKSTATVDDGSCTYYVYGCMDKKAKNYNPNADKDNNSCEYVSGCTDKYAENYNSSATMDDGSCKYETKIEDKKTSETSDSSATAGTITILAGGVAGYKIYKNKKNK